ncbi:MAG: Prabable sialidase [Paenibacillus sp.]|nr:Prabable sialidase [Paenibacillus sp.]
MKHITVYREPGRYAGWPANYGIWSWGDEIVVGYTLGYHDPSAGFHARDRSRPFVTMQARSVDGGESWESIPMPLHTPVGSLSAGEHMTEELAALQKSQQLEVNYVQEPIDFAHPDFALMFAREGVVGGSKSWIYTSSDRCHSWHGPYLLPQMGLMGVAARTDYVVSSSNECTFFLTAPTKAGSEIGSRTFSARTKDGGKTIQFQSWISPEIEDGFNIMPAAVRLSDSHIVVATRERSMTQGEKNWIDLYSSTDDGATWTYVNRPVADTGHGGNPPTLTKLIDGRLCLIYAYRDAPFGMRAKLSDDNGITWSDEIVLRSDAGSHDIGYPRTVQREDGTIVTVYYYNDELAGSCYIAATLWKP